VKTVVKLRVPQKAEPIGFSRRTLLSGVIWAVRAIAQAVSRRFLIAEAWVRAQASPSGVCGGSTWTGFSPSPSAFPCTHHSTAAPYSLICHLGDGQRTR
jgi:hypothetical protein